ncbi:MAG: LptA/OstA family protein [Pseudomonadota bacterium]
MRAGTFAYAMASLVLLASAVPASAQSFGGSTNDGPIEITAQQSLEWLSDEKRYVATGDAVATRGDVQVSADKLSALYRETDAGDTEIYLVEATGNVVIETPEERVVGDRGTYDVDKQVLVLTGNDLRLTTPTETLIAEDSLEYDQVARRATARGNATVWNERDRVSADTLVAELEEGAGGDLELSKVLGEGNVTIITPQETVRGEQGFYDVAEERAEIIGNVKITRGDNQLNGAVAEVDLATGVSRLLSAGSEPVRARGLISSEGSAPQ